MILKCSACQVQVIEEGRIAQTVTAEQLLSDSADRLIRITRAGQFLQAFATS